MKLPKWFPTTWIEVGGYLLFGLIVLVTIGSVAFSIYNEWVKFLFFLHHR